MIDKLLGNEYLATMNTVTQTGEQGRSVDQLGQYFQETNSPAILPTQYRQLNSINLVIWKRVGKPRSSYYI